MPDEKLLVRVAEVRGMRRPVDRDRRSLKTPFRQFRQRLRAVSAGTRRGTSRHLKTDSQYGTCVRANRPLWCGLHRVDAFQGKRRKGGRRVVTAGHFFYLIRSSAWSACFRKRKSVDECIFSSGANSWQIDSFPCRPTTAPVPTTKYKKNAARRIPCANNQMPGWLICERRN